MCGLKPRLVIITEIISPYRIPLFNSLAHASEVELRVIFLSENDPGLRQWKVYKDEIRFPYQVLSSWRRRLGKFNILLNGNVPGALREAAPQVILCGGYNYIASWQALFWARSQKVPFLLWSESNRSDIRSGHPVVEFFKAEFLRNCNAFVVSGRSAEEYLRTLKVRQNEIFTAPNAVDNELFCRKAHEVREDASRIRAQFNLPERYILFVGRLVPEKGVFDLLTAYSQLDQSLREQVGLVFVGDGHCRQALERQAATVRAGSIKFPGFVQREELPVYYALSEMFVLPTYTDTWGLVVNEAMACGLPVIVTRVAGCVPDLVRERWNGLIVEERSTQSLTAALTQLVAQRELSALMGVHSAEHIWAYSPQTWSSAIAEAVKRVASGND